MNIIKEKIVRLVTRMFPAYFISRDWYKLFKERLDWNNPKDLNEKIQWLKRYTDTTVWSKLSDKYEVREYIKEKGLSNILVKNYGKWDNPEKIDWDSLPNQFVMKLNNGSGGVVICENKSDLDIPYITKKLKRNLKNRFGYLTGEPHYLTIKPFIIAEELLDKNKQQIKSSSLIDYKIWCFNGKPECVFTCMNRTPKGFETMTYDLDWNGHPEWSVHSDHYKIAKNIIPRPKSFDEMLRIAAILSEGFPQVRVDLYEVDSKPYFGEMTFTSAAGMMTYFTKDYLLYLGGKVDIKGCNMKKNF